QSCLFGLFSEYPLRLTFFLLRPLRRTVKHNRISGTYKQSVFFLNTGRGFSVSFPDGRDISAAPA
ncbi:hypothetical protein EA554_25415, partial [Salmonella enterica subsp. enterica serovar Pomona]|nr:hypothetical protein [Salmonella enterica subsp. enterica serovar Pomona]